jgi:hypothetical protein
LTRVLSHNPDGRRVDSGAAVRYAASQRRVATWRIGLELMRLGHGPGGLTPDDYFLQGAWRPGLSWDERREFVGSRANHALNQALNPPVGEDGAAVTVDKLASAARFAAAGIPQPRILAVAAQNRPDASLRWLDGPEATADFLGEAGLFPCFGKPVHGSTGIGAASLLGVDRSGEILLGSGVAVDGRTLAREIWEDYAPGFLFQELVRPHPALAALIGPVIGTLRVVTVDAGRGPEALYATLKAPAAKAMVDTAAGPMGCYAAVALDTGKLLRLQDRRQMGGIDLDRFPVTGATVRAAQLPDFPAALDMACAAHRAIGNRGLLGSDILLSDRGPLMNEINGSPFHSSYQTAFARGVLNPEFLPRLQAVRERFRAVTPRPRHCPIE